MPQNESHIHHNDETTLTTSSSQSQHCTPILTLHLREPQDPILVPNSDTLCTTTMASTNSTSTDPLPSSSSDDIAVKAVNKRYEGLVTVRTKAIKGKGAWYWAHLEPILVRNPDTGVPKSVKLKCSLCDSVFSASNPSRTASEHLKRGTCSNFSSGLKPGSVPSPLPISSVAGSNRKRGSPGSPLPYQNHALAMVEIGYPQVHGNTVNQQNQHHLVLSGGKEDLCALAMFEDSVKKLKSPKTSPGPALSKDQVNSALELLADWFYECCGSVSLSTIEHRKFQAFLGQVGLPAATSLRREISGPRLDARFSEAKAESEAKIRDAMFFQVASDGWKNRNWYSLCCGGENLVKFMVNLPNGTSVFQKAVFTGGVVSSKYAEEVLWETVTGVSGSVVQSCVGIVADKFKAKALRNLEIQNHWMVNTSCQLQGFISLIKDFNNELPLFRVVTENCIKVANFVNNESQVRNIFVKYRMQELDYAGLLRVPSPKCDPLKNFASVFPMLEDILTCARVIQMVMLEDTFKVMCMEDPLAREVAGMVQNEGFWNELEAVYSLVKLIKGMVQDMEAERPLLGRCLPLWEELRTKVKEWCAKYNVVEGPVEKILEKRFRKNYHPAWSAAFILDPLYLIKDTSGKYLPPFKCLTREQEKDVDKLLTRLASREEAHVVLMELMKWRSEGLDPLYAQAVQMKQRDPVTGKMKVANPLSSRLVWETCLCELKSLGKIAVRLIFLHATSCGFKSNWSFIRKISANKNSRIGLERAQKMIYIAAHAKLERRDFSSEEEKDAELLAMTGSEDGMLAEVYADATLV
ncbi:Ribonuclease H-like superfamily [Sesbania bispinosa]|nr:Ribonuclease H-like superfamily [Sesbania bispinosa]